MGEASAGRERIGFIGVGMMGSGICRNLLAAGYPLTVVVHRSRERIDPLIAAGADEAPDVPALAAASDVVMTCVNSAEIVRDSIAAARSSLREGMLVIDVSTSLPEVSRAVADDLDAIGVHFVDAPVNGGPAQAADGSLGTFAGGEAAAFARAKPILRTYSANVAHFGPAGAGHTAKLLNNFLTVGLRQLVVHAFRAARRSDIDLQKLYDLTKGGAAGSRTLDQMAGGAASGDFLQNKFSIANCYKDMAYVEALMADDPDGHALQQAMTAAYQRLVDAGLGDRLASEMLDPAVERAARQG